MWNSPSAPTDCSRARWVRSEEHTSELQSQSNLVCRLLLEKKKAEIYVGVLSHPYTEFGQAPLQARLFPERRCYHIVPALAHCGWTGCSAPLSLFITSVPDL